MKYLCVCLLFSLSISSLSVRASAADNYEDMIKRFNAEISGLPDQVGVDFVNYAAKLQANSKNISNMQISNCSSIADFTLELLVDQGDKVAVDVVNLQYLKSRVWTSLYLSRAVSGVDMPMDTLQSELDAAKGGAALGELISRKNTKCNALLVKNAGPIEFGASK